MGTFTNTEDPAEIALCGISSGSIMIVKVKMITYNKIILEII